jgi:hypothetical protein
MKEVKKDIKPLDKSGEILKTLKRMEGHLASMVYYQNPSRGLGQSIEKYAAKGYVDEGAEAQDDLRTMIMEELQKLIEETK